MKDNETRVKELTRAKELFGFVLESNRIEGILRDSTPEEIAEHERFLALPEITVADLEAFVSVIQPGAKLRDRYGLNVRVGNHIPPAGAPEIRANLETILSNMADPWETHIRYETLHPFTDGNGRSGRALWAWQMKSFPLGFLHKFYYQTLSSRRT